MPFMDLHDTDAHEKNIKLKDMALFQALVPYIRPHYKPLLLSLLILPLISLTQVVQPMLIRHAVDGPLAHKQLAALWPITWLFLGVLSSHYALRYLQMVLAQVTGQRIVVTIRTALYNHLQSLSAQFYHTTPIGKLVTRISSDIENISDVFAQGGIAIFADFAIIIGILIAMALMHWQLALVVWAMIPIVALTMEFFRRRSRSAYNEQRIQLAKLNSHLQETLTGIDVIQLTQQEARNTMRFTQNSKGFMESNIRSVTYDSAFTASVELLSLSTIVLILATLIVTQGHLSADSPITMGVLVAFLQYVQMLFEPIEELSDKFTVIQSGLASVEKMMELMQISPAVQSPPAAIHIHQPRGHIRFENVTFGYDPKRPILVNVSLEIFPGEQVGLIGPTGAGKSTLVKLLNRQYDPQSGRITIDGEDIRNLPLPDLRHHVVMIPQEDYLFRRSVLENITLAYPKQPNLEAIRQVTDSLSITSMIEKLPEGFETQLPERGRSLSNGERQLLIFARALWHNPTVIVLDEATASIDPQTEAMVQAALERTLHGRTAIIIAHRLSTIQTVDKVYAVNNQCVLLVQNPALHSA